VIPQSFIQDLLARVDIVEVVGRHVTLKKAGQNYLGLCPFHGEKSPSFTVSSSKQFFHCFGCGAHGSAIGFLMDHRGLGYVEAVQELAQMAGLQVPRDAARDSPAAGQRRALVELTEAAAEFYRRKLKSSPAAIDYLKGRGLTGVTAARYALGYAPDEWQGLRAAFPNYEDARLVEAGLVIEADSKRYDRFRGRVMFPIRNPRGNVIGFGARVLDGSQPKYLNSPETPLFRKGQELYGLFEAAEAIRRRSRVIVCEGYLDVIQLAQAGFEETVAALGTAITSNHVSTLFRITDSVVFAFDGDAAGRAAARRALQAALAVIPDTKRASFVLLPQGEDPDSMVKSFGAEAFESEISRALSLSQWFVKAVAEGLDPSEPEGRAAMTAAARPLLESMPAGGLRLQLVRVLAQAVSAAPEDLEALYGMGRPQARPEPRRLPPRKTAARPVESLKAQILRRLVAWPALAREFAASIAALAPRPGADSAADPVDAQIGEVLDAAQCAGAVPSCAALLEALSASPYAAQYRAMAARELQQDEDLDQVRSELADGVLAIEESRVKDELDALSQALGGGDLSEETRTLNRALLKRLSELKHKRIAGGGAGA
jgi:DNA primase